MKNHSLYLETIAAYVLYRYAAAYLKQQSYLSDAWISANLCANKMEAQYNIAQNTWIAYLKNGVK